MINTSDLYKSILSKEHESEVRLLIGNKNNSISEMENMPYVSSEIVEMSTSANMFSSDSPGVGGCVSSEISVCMLTPGFQIPRQAKLVPQFRITDGERFSEWISKGVFFVDTRKVSNEGTDSENITITGYDAMLMTEVGYPESSLEWPANDIDVVDEICRFVGFSVDSRTYDIIKNKYKIGLTTEHSCREILSYIAAMYCGSFIMNDCGQLRLVRYGDLPRATNYLVDRFGAAITFGGVRILV